MSNVKFVPDDKGIQELLKGQAMQQLLSDLGKQKAMQAGHGYMSDVHVHQRRAVANIAPATARAIKDNLNNNTLLKVIGG